MQVRFKLYTHNGRQCILLSTVFNSFMIENDKTLLATVRDPATEEHHVVRLSEEEYVNLPLITFQSVALDC